MDVDGWSEQHLGAFRARFVSQRLTDLLHELRIPRGPERDTHRKAGRLDAANESAATARAVRAVGDFDRRDPMPLDRHRHPEVGPGKQ